MVHIPRPRAEMARDGVTDGHAEAHGAYDQDKRPTADELVASAMPLVGYVVTELLARLPQHVRRDELESAGYEALVRCAASYDPSIGTTFTQFARLRVRGAVLDELRSADWASRGARRAERELTGAEDRLTHQLGRRPTAAELAHETGRDGEEIHRVRDRVQRSVVLSLNALVGDGTVGLVENIPAGGPTQDEAVVTNEQMRVLAAAVQALPERLRQVVTGYFLQERPMAELARELGVTESRVSQLRAEALVLLREGLNRHLEGEQPEGVEREGVAARRREEYYARVGALAGVTGRRDAADAAWSAASTGSVRRSVSAIA
jgi:RNA polymerase sigma factor for flagellar operon FliA